LRKDQRDPGTMPIQLQEFLIERSAEEQSVKCALFAQVVSRCGSARLKVWGTSMVPGILPGDTLIVEKAPISGLAVGDVAVYARSSRLFAHRVTSIVDGVNRAVVTRGDAMECDDPPVFAEQIVGRVASIVPRPRLASRVWRRLAAIRTTAAFFFSLSFYFFSLLQS
jgi:signal peptidase I